MKQRELNKIIEIIEEWYSSLNIVMGFMTSGNKECSQYDRLNLIDQIRDNFSNRSEK